MKIVERS